MTGKVLDNSATSALILILPIAVVIVVLFSAWQWLLLLMAAIVAWRIWEKYQWQQWCKQVNPFFNQLVKENQGCLTSLDLSLKANLSGGAAKRFLEKKAEEFGAQRKIYEDKGVVYYFLTASALGSIFDDSEPVWELEGTPTVSKQVSSVQQQVKEPSPKNIAQLVDLEENQPIPEVESQVSTAEAVQSVVQAPQPLEETTPAQIEVDRSVTETPSEEAESTGLSLNQADLAKRLDINPSTVGRRKSEPDFPEWSQSKDPEGVAWKYIPETKMFIALE